MPRPLPLLALLVSSLAVRAASAEPVTVGPLLEHRGMCEASGAVPYPRGSFGDRFLVVDDESTVMALYRAGASGDALPLAGSDLGPQLGLSPEDRKADFEAATWLGPDLYVLGSHSRRRGGKQSPGRGRLAAVTVTESGGGPGLSPKGRAVKGLPQALAALSPLLAARIGLDVPARDDLDPKRKGFNIEGMAPRPDGKSLWLGLRNPLDTDANALLVPLENPAEAIAGAAPRLGAPVALDLKGRGIRDLAYAPEAKATLILAGGAGGGGEPFDLYRWSGDPADRPVRVEGAAAAFAGITDFQPEALLVSPAGDRVQVLSDDGEALGSDGKPCEESKDGKRFRSLTLGLR
ncbi:DUF3616 domain-containing protein [Methylobacterium frigidaeris]|uniref:DUF3616 domain-containing protein n=1 Tax=Methylobacterium frigidaeris TaxID=2038277 RepID=A0AA37H7Q7_9HYPH|nr:DUF3616 domain-containing protein [Methylobacterium frigidaeris]PIK74373.1 hypothetical protein CS379_02855 [Methylobacterium frigidaeris]GJD60782.1 hypothetical protein MPEAHAMD_0921 [Methylobacterium frigidaeris]